MDAHTLVARAVLTPFISMLLVGLVTGCATSSTQGQQEESTQASSNAAAPATTGSFVGEISGQPAAFVALIADKPSQQGEQEREVRAYVCDGQSINEWFDQSVSGDQFNLTSDTGATLSVGLGAYDGTGKLTLADGRSLGYEVASASGIGGLYNVNISSGGDVDGTSETGGRLEGKLDQPTGDGSTSISGTITPPNGSARSFEMSVPSSVEEGEYRWIVLNNGRIKGAKKGTPTGSSSGFINPNVGLR
jgi:hypothetical protein